MGIAEDDGGMSCISSSDGGESRQALNDAAGLFGVDVNDLEEKLLTRSLQIGKEKIVKKLNQHDAVAQRDSVSKVRTVAHTHRFTQAWTAVC